MERFKDTPLAIVGMACRLPGADSLAEYWELLTAGRCAIVEAPAERLDRRLHYDPRRGVLGKTYTDLGGVIQYRPLDALHCPVPTRILPSAEIGHLTICQVAAAACRHAGMNPFDLRLRNAGVYVGHNLGGPVAGDLIYGTLVEQSAQYLREIEAFGQLAAGREDEILEELVAQIRDGLPQRGPTGAPSCACYLGAAIISEALGLTGPTMILDAACSSSLQALAMACRALQLGRIEMAIVGGASYYHVDSQILFSRAQSASAKGSRPLDADADGLVSGEGYVAAVVKTLERAEADGDPICCVVRGIGVSSDGKGKSLWAPRKEGQVLAIRRAYERGLDIGRLQYIEAHATSTAVGDLTELKALAEAFEGQIPAGKKIPIGAVKANVGHTLEAAGLAALIKTALAMQHGTIPRQVGISRLNPGFDWEHGPLTVPTANLPWPEFEDGHPRRAAVNAFGIGGLNVHVVLDEYRPGAAGTSARAAASPASEATRSEEAVAIVGAGCIFAGARTLDAFWDLLNSGRDPKCEVPADRWNAALGCELGSRRPWRSPCKRGGFITDFEYDWRRHKAPPNQVAKADPLQLMILDSTDAALADAGYDQKPYDKTRVGVVVGTIFGSDFCEQLQLGFRLPDFCDQLAKFLRGRGVSEDEIEALSEAYRQTLLKHMPALLDETGGFTPSTLASRITKTFDWMGGAATVDAGQASAVAAIGTAVDQLLDGSCDMVVCAAGHRALGLPTYEMLALEGRLASGDPKAPFDAEADGYLPGEGVGVVVLKRLSDAQRDGDRIRGIIRGVGAGFAGSRREAVGQAMEKAYRIAGARLDDVAMLETTGTGRAEDDEQEVAAMAEGLGETRDKPVLLGSVVGQIGHTQGASGMASLMAAMRSLEEENAPASFGARTPLPELVAEGSQVRLATAAAALKPRGGDGKLLAGITCTDPWGAAGHLVLERGVEATVEVKPGPAGSTVCGTEAIGTWRIARIGAGSLADLKSRAAEAASQAAELFGGGRKAFGPEDPFRLAVLAESATDLRTKLQLAGAQLGTPQAVMLGRKDVFYGRLTEPIGKVALLFSGQGSQYADMLKPMVEEFGPAAETMGRIDETLRRLGIPTFAEVAWGEGKALGKDVWMTQLSLMCADTIVYESLRALGIHPDYVAGHSYGEYPALAAAGAWDFENAVRGTRVRCEAIEACRNSHGRMLSVAADGPTVERICKELGEAVYPANYNAPDQTVVGGTEEGIARLEADLKARGVASLALPVPRPFHTPLMADVCEPLRRGLEPICFGPPRVPMLTGVTNEYVASGEEIRANLVAQMVSPVRYVELIGRLADEGVRVMVEVGPRQVLTGLHSKILAGREVVAIACDDKTRAGASRLLAVRACLDVWGLLDRPRVAPVVNVFEGVPAESPVEPVAEAEAASDVLVLTGTAYEIGRQHGLALAEEIHAIARRYADAAGASVGLPTSGDVMAGLQEEEREELRGVADGAGVSMEMLAVYNAWLDGSATEGETETVVASRNGKGGVMHAIDRGPSGEWPWCELAAARKVRTYRPSSGLAHAVVAAPGALGAAAGMNQRGLAVSVASGHGAKGVGATLRTLLVRRILRLAAEPDAAVELLRKANGEPGWEFCISHAAADRMWRVRFGAKGVEVEAAQAGEPAPKDKSPAVVMIPSRGEIVSRWATDDGQEASSRFCLEGVTEVRLEPKAVEERPAVAKSASPVIPLEEYLAASQSVEGRPPFEVGDQACCRFVLRMLRTPVPEVDAALEELSGPALIVGQNAVGMALRRQIEALGVRAVVLPMSDDAGKMVAMVEKIWQAYRPPHLFLVTPFDEEAGASVGAEAWERRRRRGVMLPYLACQKWFALVSENRLVEQASVVAATAMGGDFGLSGRVESLESGAMTGLVKALCIEFGYTTNWAFRTKVVDAPRSQPPEELAEALLRELRAISFFAEMGYAGRERYVIGALHKPAEPSAANTPQRGRPWLVTGGARGITAAIAREMGERFGVKLHLVGTSPKPQVDPAWRDLTAEGRKELRGQLMKQALAEKKLPAELWKRAEKDLEIDRTLRDMEQAGLSVTYHACDVSDREAVARLLEEIRRTDGPLEGIVHGAGIEIACRFAKKDPEIVSKTIAAKVDGAAALMDLTREDPLRYFFGFGSISGRWGSIGQTDYALASDMLAKLIDWYRVERPECRSTCLHWQPWAEIGMAARDETRGGNMLQRLTFLPPEEGVRHFVDEMLAGCPEPEVLVTDWNYYKAYHPDLSEEQIAETYCRTIVEPSWGSGAGDRREQEVSEGPEPKVEERAEQVALRHVMRMVDAPLREAKRRPLALTGPALVLGDNADAQALCRRLSAVGVEVRRLPIGDGVEETLSAAEWLLDGHPAPHLFLMTGRDAEGASIDSREAWLRRRHRGVVLPYLVCQKWLTLVDEAKLRPQASLAAATSLGGDFGFAAAVVSPEGGALSGLLKGLYLEAQGSKLGELRVKVVDAPADEPPEAVAEAVLGELEVDGFDVEAAYAGGVRRVVRLALEPVEPLVREEIPRGGVWVFTGGARGITGAVAKAMGQRFGLKLHLLGKSPAPQIDPAWRELDEPQLRQLKRSLAKKAIAEGKPAGTYWDRARVDLEIDGTLRELAASGVEATYHSCDVTNWEELDRTLRRIREMDGPIDGIVHGAGLQGSAMTIGETPVHILQEMVDVKLDAAMGLLTLTREDPVRCFVGFGSISGRFGTSSAATYTLANDMLCKLIGWERGRRPGWHGVGIHWHPWGEVGMMTRPVSQHTIMIMKMKLLPPAEGVEHVIDELRAGTPESEVLITDSQFYETFYSADLLLKGGGRREGEGAGKGALIGRVATLEPGRRVQVEIGLDPIGDPFLREHRLRDKPTLPMVVAMEAFAEAASLVTGGGQTVAAVRDVEIADSVRLLSDEPGEVRVDAEASEEGVRCRLTSDFRNRRGQLVQKDRLHFSGTVELAGGPVAIGKLDVPAGLEWHEVTYPARDALMYHGPPLRLLKRVAIEEGGGWGQIELPRQDELAGERDADGWLTPSAAIDACYYGCGVYTWVYTEGGVTVPDRLAELLLGRAGRPGERTTVRVECRELGAQHGVFDFALVGDDGEVILQVKGYRCHVLGGGAQKANS